MSASAVLKEILGYAAGLAGDDACVVAGHGAIAIKSTLQSRHRLLGGAGGELLRLGLRGVVARGGLLCAGGGEERGDDGGQENDHQQRQNERRGVFCVFGEISFHWAELTTTEGGKNDRAIIIISIPVKIKIFKGLYTYSGWVRLWSTR